uniref:WGS project CAEQ00000000 data, annotated contig 506 n=1 Tax=Trypanosoma congolense (strain IL3000) TaxID=1068625 RepID=F9WGI6_TRYCI|nr:unnamed protein product [Trypanosoma congolense IL3000]
MPLDDFVSRVAQRSSLSGNATPFTPSYLNQPNTLSNNREAGASGGIVRRSTGGAGAELAGLQNSKKKQRKTSKNANNGKVVSMKERKCGDDDDSGQKETLNTATSNTLQSALNVGKGISNEELRLLEGFLCDSDPNFTSGKGGARYEDGIFMNDDEQMQSEEEEWLLQQMMDIEIGGDKLLKLEEESL